MKIHLQTPTEDVQVQLIPFIDVIFCILTFFILAALQFTRQEAINVDLPKVSSATAKAIESQGKEQRLLLGIDAIGQTYIGNQPVKPQELKAALKDYLQKNPQGSVVLNANGSTSYNDVLTTLDSLRQVGGDRVFLGVASTSSTTSTQVPQPASSKALVNPNVPQAEPLPGSPNIYVPAPGNQAPLPVIPGATQGQNVSPVNPGVYPVYPQVPASKEPVGVPKTKSAATKR